MSEGRVSVGKALEKHLKMEEEERPERGGRSEFLLMNENRDAIFSYLCKYPCTRLSDISYATGIGEHTAEWHMKKLIESGYVEAHKIGNFNVYFPLGLIALEDIPLFTTLNRPNMRDVLMKVLESPGMEQKEITDIMGQSRQAVSSKLEHLVEVNLVAVISEGRHKRYYPSSTIKDVAARENNQKKLFTTYLIKKLKGDGLDPQIIRAGPDDLIIELKIRREKKVLVIPLNSLFSIILER